MSSFAVFASGRGSNFEAILHAKQEGLLQSELVALVCDQPEAPVIEKAKAAGIPTFVIPLVSAAEASGSSPQSLAERRTLHEERILKALLPFAPRFLVMAGYMRLLGPTLLGAFAERGEASGHHRIVNVHPSLLPAFPGVNAYRQAYESGTHFAGVTVHLVDEKMDHGPICAQEAFSIRDCASVDEVEKLGLQIEHRLYPSTLKWILEEKFTVESASDDRKGNRTRVRPH
ncbi:MAG: phosphoribosylglycinamide formyltransferase [Methylotenera sp.]|nr:phosphoribosylglycinamide formyltransferase [Oligoflexia bacterium]